MKDDRLRVPIDEPYLYSVGLATICFARLEWDAVWCCEKLQPGYVQTIGTEKKTAGRIATDLINLAAAHSDAAIKASLGHAAAEFKRLVGRRNDLLHANPSTAAGGDQRLIRNDSVWTIPMVNDLADEFVAASLPLNDHLHRLL